jgi:hypothetical protein
MVIKTTQQLLNLVEHLPNKESHLYFVHQLISKKAGKKFIFLSSKQLRITFGENYSDITRYLTSIGVIEISRWYTSDKYYCNKFSLKPYLSFIFTFL